ncbi:hypothetical protein AB832_07295 [Flavobacteriaceae bacterium (ex Bugula neritina AB1)]|nr:hypothetical protein AB832_07295 [Flavobacteriaceae bacterium (ex Bugula neritina AB1)]
MGPLRRNLKVLESKLKAKSMLEKAKALSHSEREDYMEQLTWYAKGLTAHPEARENVPEYKEDSRRALREIKRFHKET